MLHTTLSWKMNAQEDGSSVAILDPNNSLPVLPSCHLKIAVIYKTGA